MRYVRSLAVVLAAVLVASGCASEAASTPTAPSPSASSSASPSPSASPTDARLAESALAQCRALDDQVEKLVRSKINGKWWVPELAKRDLRLDGGLLGCRWEGETRQVSIVKGPAPLGDPVSVIDEAWVDRMRHPLPKGSEGKRWLGSLGHSSMAIWTSDDDTVQAAVLVQGVPPDDDNRWAPWELARSMIDLDTSSGGTE